MEMKENEWNISNLVWKQYVGNGIKLFYDNITIRDWIYKGILEVLEKKIIKFNFILFHSSQFWGEWKFDVLRE